MSEETRQFPHPSEISNGRCLCRFGPDRRARVKGDVQLLRASFPNLRGEGVGTLKSFVNGLGNRDFDLAGVLMISSPVDGPARGEEWTAKGLPPAGLIPLVIGLGSLGTNMLSESSRVNK